MNFAELRFWGYLLAGLGVILGVRGGVRRFWPGRLPIYDRTALACLGMFLLGCVSWLTLTIWCAVAMASYVGLRLILRHDPGSPRKYLVLLIPLQLGPLLYYKYSHFFLNQVCGLGLDTLRDLMIPVGLSFYTFQKVAFVLDTLAFKEPLPRFLDYLNFAGFFPQIVAGPIERKRDLLPQMESFGFRWDRAAVDEGMSWVIVGLFFKLVLADNLAQWMPSFMRSADNAYMIWLSNLLFGLRIYYDFAGYSLVAFGLGRCFGVQLTLNFLSPYCATSIQEFWRRWHVTLSNWFRDYVYIPLGGGRVRWWAANLALVFVVSGIWHGAGWNFVIWGAMHGGFLLAHRLSGRRPWPAWLGWGSTMFGAFLAWLCFYETRTDVLAAKLVHLGRLEAYGPAAWQALGQVLTPGQLLVLSCVLVLAALTLTLEWASVRRDGQPYAWLRRPWVLGLLVVAIVVLAPGTNNAFIYFAF